MSFKINIVAVIILISVLQCFAQEKTNLQVFELLVDSSVITLTSSIPYTVRPLNIEMNTGTSYEIFNSEIISDLNQKGYKLIPDEQAFRIQYFIKSASVSYGNMFRHGILGDYFVPRSVQLSGNFNITLGSTITNNFNYSFKDTVNVDDVKNLENPAYPFTQGKLPTEPFFSGILEPVVAVGTVALAVILFFTVRSK